MRAWITALGCLLLMSLTMAQMFRDVPRNHWAYQAIQELRRLGFIEGYPDNTFRPDQTLTRAEFAQLIARLYRNIDQRLRDFQQSLETLPAPAETPQPSPSPLEERVQRLERTLEELRQIAQANTILQRLRSEFEPELRQLNLVVEDIRDEVQSLEERLRAHEREARRFTGDMAFGVFSTHSFDKRSAYTLSGREINPTGKFLQSFVIAHELGLHLDQPINESVEARATFTIGNYLPYVGSANRLADILRSNKTARSAGATDFTIWEATIQFPLELFGQQFKAVVGRYPLKLSPYTFQRIEPDAYLDFARYRDGAHRVDGAMLSAEWSAFRFLFFLGSSWGIRSNTTNPFPIYVANHNSSISGTIDQMVGFHAQYRTQAISNIPLTIGATYFTGGVGRNRRYEHGNTTVANNIDRVELYALELQSEFSGIKVRFDYAQSMLLRSDSRQVGSKNALFAVVGEYAFSERWNLLWGYREIEPYFVSPGNWGRVGYAYNPSDIKGTYIVTTYQASEDLNLKLSADFYTGSGKLPPARGYRGRDRLQRIMVEADYQLTPRWRLQASYENVGWRLQQFRPEWNYLTLKAHYDLGESLYLNALYQIISTNGKGARAEYAGGPSTAGNRAGVFALNLGFVF